MRFLIFLPTFLLSFFCLGQETINQKYLKYKYLDSIDVYSKQFPTKLAEGSGKIYDKKRKVIGFAGFSVETTKNMDGKIIRILNSNTNHYNETHSIGKRTVITEISIYFDEYEIPDLAKFHTEEFIENTQTTSKTEFLEIKKIDFDKKELSFNEKRIKSLLDDIKK